MSLKNRSSAAIMLKSLMKMLVLITLALGFLIIVAVGHQLLEEVNATTAHITTSLKKTDIDGDDDWENWRRNSTLDTSASFVYVNNRRADARVKHYYSPHAKEILAVQPAKIPMIDNLYYRRGIGFLYHRMGHARGIYYTLWQTMNPQAAILLRVVMVTVLLLGLTLILSPFYIRRLTRRLTDSLSQLSATTKVIAADPEPGGLALPVPPYPEEVTELATNFNALLAQLNARQQQQKLFVMNAAHELRTPIATIRSHAQLIERHAEAHPEIVPKSVHYITEESRQMQQLIDDLLQLSRADQLPEDLTLIDLSQELNEIIAKRKPTLNQPLAVSIPAGIDAQINANALEQIIGNLLANAGKYSPPTSQITVKLQLGKNQSRVITVANLGPTIAQADLPHIFERFYRSADVRGSIPGTGLGLSIVKQLTDLAHGTITAEANQPQGMIFTLTLPKPAGSPAK